MCRRKQVKEQLSKALAILRSSNKRPQVWQTADFKAKWNSMLKSIGDSESANKTFMDELQIKEDPLLDGHFWANLLGYHVLDKIDYLSK